MTGPQTKAFWRAFGVACSSQGLASKDEREAYRKTAMREELGVEHMSQVDTGKGYDRLMARILSDAGDYEGAAKYLINDAKKIARCVEDCADQIADLTGNITDALSYIAGVLRQSNLGPVRVEQNPCEGYDDFWMDIPEDNLRTIFQILDTQRRRLLKRANYTGRIRYTYGQRYYIGMEGDIHPVSAPDTIRRYGNYHVQLIA